ncbi:MAG TPA: bifunctional diaminohydroxyphosphoribosylaminopyrimidine deaminase/5-amino-6-(5-phosphoribosylamino)uracil reductase RibD [Burkholderiales bacterium]|nr:bifunctional diaminohydroxyphosphoribosylaminopyrimidine deaminase/5-amino-6-(5-phosphoribosylamino)uracil reductase RibD [Burkholderiales bacterium]
MFSAADHMYMARALQLARRALDTSSPNPRVGCVIVRGDAVIAEGWHARAGEPHAEIHALRQAAEQARGATVYVSLEPCSHHGRTPPCADALVDAQVARVVAAMRDPNPKVAGSGLVRLQAAGIATTSGLLEVQARELNIGFVSRMERGRPWLRVKTAASLDGRTALANGVSQWITGLPARRDGHRWRARSCAVMTGIGTLLHDDSRLTVREVEATRQPLRIVVDRDLLLPPDARIFEDPAPVLVFTALEDRAKRAVLEQRGAQVVSLPDGQGKVDLRRMLEELARREINEILVESGNRLNGALLRAGLVDELVVYLAPQLLGDRARGMFDLGEITALDARVDLSIHDVRRIGEDWRIIARVARKEP